MPRGDASESIAEELARHGLRATRQRVAALQILRAHRGHPTASEVHERMLRRVPSVSQKTVYEALDALVSARLATRVAAGGEPWRYEARPEPHYHARCRVCGKLSDVPALADGPIRGRTPLPEGFRVESIQVTLEGRCLRCADEI